MKTIWKFVVPVTDEAFSIFMPEGARIVHVGSNWDSSVGVVCFWAEARLDTANEERHFRVFGTGHKMPDNVGYVGSVILANGGLVWHLYEVFADG